ncbi:phage holin family protein [Methylovulum psychrotolerans]|uniref:Holin n=1 Tax=Methylovulum psychrotolerans TaxID=1704499 RepID=A0A2S5CGG4_9GAMM|nr:phage holin family protein [Methylovulum psychrotolerans]POZ49900.1 hypothetical protein AADEFJLK_04346 [Methylovulum psychrotolerans]
MEKPVLEVFGLSADAVTFLWVAFWGACGGTVKYIQKLNKGYCRFSVTELIGEWVVSGFVGLLTYLLCDSAGLEVKVSAFLIGVTGHMGSGAIVIFEKAAQALFTKWFGKNDTPA